MDPIDHGDGNALTALYVPADRPDRVQKALDMSVNCVIVDLEDAVAASRKNDSRAGLREVLNEEVLASCEVSSIQIRVNAVGTEWHSLDMEYVKQLPESIGVRLPKVTQIEDISQVREIDPRRSIHALIESPEGVEHAFEIATSGISSLGLGEADLRSSLGLPTVSARDEGLAWARARIINAAAAAGLAPPLMSPHTNIKDEDGLKASSIEGRKLGFQGRVAIHPRQLPIIDNIFRPSVAEVTRAEDILNQLDKAKDSGRGVVTLEDGTFLDAAMINSAKRTLALYHS